MVNLTKWTQAPQHTRMSDLQDQIESNELQVFAAIQREQLQDEGELSSLRSDMAKAENLRAEAQKLWDSIPVGEVIAKGRPSAMGPVGENKRVTELRDEASQIEADMLRRQREIAVATGHKLLSTPSAHVWNRHAELTEQIAAIRADNAWYYESHWGTLVSVIHNISLVLAIILVFPTGILGIWMIFWVLSLAK